MTHHVKRPLFTKSGIQDAGGSTFSSNVTVQGTLTHSAARIYSGRFKLPTESLTNTTGAAQTINNYGVSFITQGTSGTSDDIGDWVLSKPTAAGDLKYIFVQNNTTSVELNINTSSTALVFWGTTFNTLNCAAASTGSPGGTPAGTMAVKLVGASTTQWAVCPGTTFNWDVVGSTGSTITA